MSEQKYYVKLRPEIMYYSSYDGFESTIYTDFGLINQESLSRQSIEIKSQNQN